LVLGCSEVNDNYKNKTLWVTGTTLDKKGLVTALAESVDLEVDLSLIPEQEALSQLKTFITKRGLQKKLTQSTLDAIANLCVPEQSEPCITPSTEEILGTQNPLTFEGWMAGHAHLFL